MNIFTQPENELRAVHLIEILEPDPKDCPTAALPPEGNVKIRNYRIINETIRAYTPTGDTHMSPSKVVPKFEVYSNISPPRARILELLRPEDEGRDALEAIVRPSLRRGLTRPLDEDTRRFLQRALKSPSSFSTNDTTDLQAQQKTKEIEPVEPPKSQEMEPGICLADELREAEEEEKSGGLMRRDIFLEFRKRGIKEAVERDQLGKLALSVEEDEDGDESGMSGAARRLDALLAESRGLHAELAGIQQDMQVQAARACRCAAAARALEAEARTLRYLDDVVALLRGDVLSARRARAWPFAIGRRQPGRNYIV